MIGWLSKLIAIDNLGCRKYKWNSAKFLIDFKKKILKLTAYIEIFQVVQSSLLYTLSADVNMKGYHLYVSLPKIVN